MPGSQSIQLIGIRTEGGTVSQDFVTAPHVAYSYPGSPLQTFVLGAEWTNLTSVTFHTPQQKQGFDNIHVAEAPAAATPEPATVAMWGLGVASMGLVGCRRRARPELTANVDGSGN